jgi:hypothetical protein
MSMVSLSKTLMGKKIKRQTYACVDITLLKT